MKTYRVSIVFSDGSYSTEATASSEDAAKSLVLMDARMGTPAHPCFFGKVLSMTAEPIK